MGKPLCIEKHGRVTELRLDRPDVGNRIDAALIRALHEACEEIAADAETRAVVLTGEEAAFCAGWDTASLTGDTPPATVEALRTAGILDDPFGCLEAMPRPVVAAIEGDAVSGGLALALAADIRVAGSDSTFTLPEVETGQVPMGGTLQRLARIVGTGHALRMALTGEAIGAEEALSIGLVSEVCPSGTVSERAHEIAGRIAERGPLAVQYAKEAIHRGIDMPLEQALRYETDLTVILQTTEDRAEGVRAFLEKRKPEFRGR